MGPVPLTRPPAIKERSQQSHCNQRLVLDNEDQAFCQSSAHDKSSVDERAPLSDRQMCVGMSPSGAHRSAMNEAEDGSTGEGSVREPLNKRWAYGRVPAQGTSSEQGESNRGTPSTFGVMWSHGFRMGSARRLCADKLTNIDGCVLPSRRVRGSSKASIAPKATAIS